ncbi:UNVERIFIED_CONTAM: putative protein, chloroplastic [Sesamum radiatum]|uniref:Iron-sulfur cluster biosynthesis family protein n=1 Tax=Sesamum radiatum TaxID=300843 RepID=A0AAW2NMS8_SESRA
MASSISACFFNVNPKSHSLTLSPRPLKPSQFRCFAPPLPSLILPRAPNLRCGRTSVSLIRASSSGVDVAAASAMRPGGSVESDRLPSDVRKRAMDAIDACGRRVTIGDVASKAGLKLNEAQKALQALAADTNGFLEVSDEGDVLYVFPKDYRSKLASKSFRLKVEPLLEKGKMAAEYLVRVSFGTALIASMFLVYTTIIAIISSSREEDNRGRRGRSYDTGFTFYFSPTDLFWYWDPYYYRRRQLREGDGGMNFIESVFSFVFGDGDPNQGIEEERWKLGNILYRFPSLQRTAAPQRSGRKEYVGRRWADWVGGVEKFFKEKKWQFSKTSTSERAMAIGLGGLNLFGVIILGTMLKNMAVSPSGFVSFVSSIFPLLQIYAGSFFAIPLIRWFFVQNKNAQIVKRNRAREQRAKALASPDLSLRRKLLSARDMAQKTFISQDRIVYSTDRDLYEQDYETREWDRRFKEIEKSD